MKTAKSTLILLFILTIACNDIPKEVQMEKEADEILEEMSDQKSKQDPTIENPSRKDSSEVSIE